MKLTKSQLKQIIKEELEKEKMENLLKFFADFESLEDAEYFLRALTDEEREFIKTAIKKRNKQ